MSRLDYHYKKHKKEFGNITKSEYLNKARKLLGASKSNNILEKKSKKNLMVNTVIINIIKKQMNFYL